MIFFLLLCLIILSTLPVSGQSTVANTFKNDNTLKYGFSYFGFYKLNPKWGIHTDVQFRMDESLKFMFQDVFRVGVIRYLPPDFSLTGGYVLLNTYSETYEDYFSEHRLWEQIGYYHKFNRRTVIARFRVEQRYLEKLKLLPTNEVKTDSYLYGNRMRLYNRVRFDLTKDREAENVFYFALQNEAFFNVAAPNLNRNFFDQNRFLMVIGITKNKNTHLETGYVNVFLNPDQRHNIKVHSLHFAVIQSLNFQKAK